MFWLPWKPPLSRSALQPIRTLWRWCNMGWREAVRSWSVRPVLHMLSSNGICREITATAGKRWTPHVVFYRHTVSWCVLFLIKCSIKLQKFWISLNFTDVVQWQMSIFTDEHQVCLLDVSSTVFHFILLLAADLCAVWDIWKMTPSVILSRLSVTVIKWFKLCLNDAWFLT